MSSVLADKMALRSAPFGTEDTPSIRMKIVGGKPVFGYEGTNSGSHTRLGLMSYRSNGTTPRVGTPVKLTPLTAKPNQVDPAELVRMVKEQQYPPPARSGFHTADKVLED